MARGVPYSLLRDKWTAFISANPILREVSVHTVEMLARGDARESVSGALRRFSGEVLRVAGEPEQPAGDLGNASTQVGATQDNHWDVPYVSDLDNVVAPDDSCLDEFEFPFF